MNKSKADSYSRKLKECRLDPVADPLIGGIPKPSPISSGFSTGEVLEKALGWQQELAARVREYQEEPNISFEQRTEAANFLVNLAAEAAMSIEALSRAFPDAFRAVASRKGAFPVNFPVLPEDRESTIRWLDETLCLGSKHELKLRRGRKPFSRKTFANNLLLGYIGRIKARAIELQRLRIEHPFELEDVQLLPEENLVLHAPLSEATAKEWMQVIWKLLLVEYPAPEKDRRLRQFGAHKAKRTRIALGKSSPKSEAANIRAAIRDTLLKYLYRLLPDK
jgi:hypothetical protein